MNDPYLTAAVAFQWLFLAIVGALLVLGLVAAIRWFLRDHSAAGQPTLDEPHGRPVTTIPQFTRHRIN